jgi:succinylglutamic semialdehyde dehydrogenase
MSSIEIVSSEPATGAILWRGMPGDPAEEVGIARGAWADWASRSLSVRTETLRRFANVVRQRADAFADLIAREVGKPLWEARTEVESVVARVDIAVSSYAERTPQRRMEGAMGARTAVRHKPHGVLAVIGPFNSPAQVPAGHIIPALLAGNAIVFKPSEKAPATGQMLIACLHEAGVPPGVARFVAGGTAEGATLAADPRIDGMLFTGSTKTGLALHRQFAETPNRLLGLELGGNNPLVVWDTPDISSAAVLVVQSAFLSAGQRCTAARRLIVREGAHQPLVAEICKLITRIIVDEPHARPAPFMGPMIDNAAADAIEERFLGLIMRGGRAMNHLERLVPGLPFLSPALIDVTGIANRADEEIFGPVLQMIRVPDFDAAIVEANATRYGLAAALIGGAPELYDRFWANVRAGIVNWNRPTSGAVAKAPTGGVGMSGNNRPSGYYAADHAAFPVVSSEADQARASIGVGLRDA